MQRETYQNAYTTACTTENITQKTFEHKKMYTQPQSKVDCQL